MILEIAPEEPDIKIHIYGCPHDAWITLREFYRISYYKSASVDIVAYADACGSAKLLLKNAYWSRSMTVSVDRIKVLWAYT